MPKNEPKPLKEFLSIGKAVDTLLGKQAPKRVIDLPVALNLRRVAMLRAPQIAQPIGVYRDANGNVVIFPSVFQL